MPARRAGRHHPSRWASGFQRAWLSSPSLSIPACVSSVAQVNLHGRRLCEFVSKKKKKTSNWLERFLVRGKPTLSGPPTAAVSNFHCFATALAS